jgi:hypothetical protein
MRTRNNSFIANQAAFQCPAHNQHFREATICGQKLTKRTICCLELFVTKQAAVYVYS